MKKGQKNERKKGSEEERTKGNEREDRREKVRRSREGLLRVTSSFTGKWHCKGLARP